MIMGNLRSSLQRELERFFGALPQQEAPPTDAAFCEARMKVQPEAFSTVNNSVVQFYYRNWTVERLEGYRLVCIDGSTVRLRGVKPECAEYFAGEAGWDPASGTALARISYCYDLLNGLILDGTISPYAVGEQLLAGGHLEHCGPGSLTLLDRNYPSFRLLKQIDSQGGKFCARLKARQWTRLLGDFLQSADRERTVDWEPSADQRAQCEELEIPSGALRVRLIKIVLNSGETEVLVTNLLDQQIWTLKRLGQVYGMRWGVEERYKFSKIRSEMERWSGKSQRAVEQDFHGRVLLENLSTIFSKEAQGIVEEQTRHCRYRHQVNRTRALSLTREILYQLLLVPKAFVELFGQMVARYAQKPCPIRAGRRYPRNFRPKHDFSFPYKALA